MTNLNHTEFAGHPQYQTSGLVNWTRFAPLLLIAVLLSIGLGFFLRSITGQLLLMSALVSLPVAFWLKYAVKWGQCRNPLMAKYCGFLCGALIYLAFFQAGLAKAGGRDYLYRLDYLPSYIHQYMAQQPWVPPGEKATTKSEPAPARVVALLYGFTLAEVAIAMLLCGGIGAIYVNNVFSESEQRWARREIMFYPRGSSTAICSALAGNELEEKLPRSIENPGDTEAAYVIMELPSSQTKSGPGLGPDDTVYITVGELEKASNTVHGIPDKPRIKQIAFSGDEVLEVLGKKLKITAI